MKNKLKIFKNKHVLIVSLLLLVILTSVSVGYALYNEELTIAGNVSLTPVGMVEITNVKVLSQSNITESSHDYSNKFTSEGCGNTLDLNTNIQKGSSGEIKYQITFTNNSKSSYTYNGISYNDDASLYAPRINDLRKGYVLEAGKSITATVIYFYENKISSNKAYDSETVFRWLTGNQSVNYSNLGVTISSGLDYTLDTSANNGNAKVTMKVNNLNDVSVKYSLKVSNSNLEIRNASNSSDSFTNILEPGNTDTQTFYLAVVDQSITENKTSIILVYEDGREETVENTITVNVPKPKIDVTFSVEPYSGWANHYQVTYVITNNTGHDISNWTIYIKLANPIIMYGEKSYLYDSYSETTNIITINNINQYNSSLSYPIEAGKTFTGSIDIGSNYTVNADYFSVYDFKETSETSLGNLNYWVKS